MILSSHERISNIQNKSEIRIKIGNNEINRTKSTKSSGAIIDEHLYVWKKQIDSIKVINTK